MFSSISSLWEVVYRYDAKTDLNSLVGSIGVLFNHGDKDVTAPLSSIQNLVKNDSRWQLQVLPGLDHHPFLHDTDGCLESITKFLQSRKR